jgi:hypothetical protein
MKKTNCDQKSDDEIGGFVSVLKGQVFLLTPRGWVFFVSIERGCALEGGCVLEGISKVFNIMHWKEVGEWMLIMKALRLHQISIGGCQL